MSTLDDLGRRIASLRNDAIAAPNGEGGNLSDRAYFRTSLALLELEWLVLKAVCQRLRSSGATPAGIAAAARIETRLALQITQLAGEIAGPGNVVDRRGLSHNAGPAIAAAPAGPLQDHVAQLAAAAVCEAASAEKIAEFLLGQAIPE